MTIPVKNMFPVGPDISYFVRHDDALYSGTYKLAASLCTVSTTGFGNGTLRASPFILGKEKILSRVGIYVQNAGNAAARARLGIYKDTGNTSPGELFLDIGEVSVGTTGLKEISGLTKVMPAGLYWLAAIVGGPGGSPVLYCLSGTLTVNVIGFNSALGGFQVWHGSHTHTVGNPLPTTFPLVGYVPATSPGIAIMMRFSA